MNGSINNGTDIRVVRCGTQHRRRFRIAAAVLCYFVLPEIAGALTLAIDPYCPSFCTIVVAPGGQYRFVKNGDDNMTVYHETSGQSSLFYKVLDNRRLSDDVVLSRSGILIARRGPHGNLVSVAPRDAIAINFYDHGKEIVSYTVADLINNLSCLKHQSIGALETYSWGDSLTWADDGQPDVVEVQTFDGADFTFDIRTGKLLERKQVSTGCGWTQRDVAKFLIKHQRSEIPKW